MQKIEIKNHYNNSTSKNVRSYDEQHELIKEIVHKVRSGKKVYVTFADELSREGSIPYIKEIHHIVMIDPLSQTRPWTQFRNRDHETHMYSFSCKLAWEGRKNIIEYWSDGLIYLPEQTQSVWVYKNASKLLEEYELPDLLDRLGNNISVGDFVTYIRHDCNVGPVLEFGTVSTIKDVKKNNDLVRELYCKNIPLNKNDKIKEQRVNSDNVCVISDDLKKQLMLKKLQGI